jgi:hypothetical protein
VTAAQPKPRLSEKQQKCSCDDCTAARTTTISKAGVVKLGQPRTGHDRLIKQHQRRNSRGKARRKGKGRR